MPLDVPPVSVLSVKRPAQISNYRSIGSKSVILAGFLALGAIVRLGLSISSSVRKRRKDLALLRALGFLQRQLAASVSRQATVIALTGTLVGIPAGIVIGRELWVLFAKNINAVPDPSIPAFAVVLLGVGAVVFANLVAVRPGRSASKIPASLAFRTE